MVNRKTGRKAAPSAKKAPGSAARPQAARTRSTPHPVKKKKVATRPAAPKPAARVKARPAKAAPSKARPTRSVAAKTAPAKATGSKSARIKATRTKSVPTKTPSAKTTRKASSSPARRPAAPARAAAASRDDDARRRVQALEQERVNLQNLGNQMRAELDSALAEAERLRERLREQTRDMETAQTRHATVDQSSSSPGGFDAAADLDEDIPATSDDDLEETAGFFDRMDEIRARRNELDRERNDRELEQSDQPFWMICPKCGDLMEESEGENVKLERCENCGGLYLDRGEVDLILSFCAGPDAYRRIHNIMKF